jgi:outer membrane protein TolC
VSAALLAGAGLAFADQGQGGDPPVLTLTMAVQEALASGGRAAAARERVTAASLDRQAANGALALQVTPSGYGALGNRDLANQSVGLDVTRQFSTGTQVRGVARSTSARNQLGTYYFSESTLLVSQPLLQGFGRYGVRNAIDAALAGERAAAFAQSTQERDIVLEVVGAYFRVVSEEGRRVVADRAVERARRLADQSAARMRAGRVSQVDVLRAEQLVAQTETAALDVQAAVQEARDRLRLLIAWDLDRDFAVSAEVPSPAPPPALSDALALALERRPEVASAREALAEAERQAKATRVRALPQLDLQLALTRQSTGADAWSSFGSGPFRVSTFLATSVPLNRRDADVARARAELSIRARTRERDEVTRQVQMEVRQAIREQDRAAQAVRLAGRSVDIATRETEIARFRFERGLASNLDVVSAEVALLSTQQQEIDARVASAIARMRLAAAMGTLDPDGEAF